MSRGGRHTKPDYEDRVPLYPLKREAAMFDPDEMDRAARLASE